LVDQVLGSMGITPDISTPAERAQVLRQLVSAIYARPPIALADLAPLPFVVHQDPVAREILVSASAALANLLPAVRAADLPGPVVVGGSVLVRGFLSAPPSLQADLVAPAGGEPVIPVPDGLVGAAVLALRHAGGDVDEALFRTVQAEVARLADDP
jgi:hypothetical protein